MLTLWRKKLYKEIENHNFKGKLLDLGGSRMSGYNELIKNVSDITVVNFDENYKHDLNFDLEKEFPLDSCKYDSVLCLNVLEHVFNYQNLIKETKRILKDDGEFIIGVPFLIQIHPCPNDYWRFSSDALRMVLEGEGFKDIQIKELGTGVFGATYQLKYNIYKYNVIRFIACYWSIFLDRLISIVIKNNFGSKKYYPLGYFVIARK